MFLIDTSGQVQLLNKLNLIIQLVNYPLHLWCWVSINKVCKCKEYCMSHECIQLKTKHGKQHLLQQIMFTIYKDTLNRDTKRCPKNTTMHTGNEGKIRFWKYILLVIAPYCGVYFNHTKKFANTLHFKSKSINSEKIVLEWNEYLSS